MPRVFVFADKQFAQGYLVPPTPDSSLAADNLVKTAPLGADLPVAAETTDATAPRAVVGAVAGTVAGAKASAAGDVPSAEAFGELEALRLELSAACQELQVSRDRFQAILDAVPGGVSWLDRELVYLGINSHLAQTFGLSPTDFIGHPIGFLSVSPEFERFARTFFEGPQESDNHEIEMEIGGQERIYFMMARKYRGGNSALFVGIDITERKQAERKLLRDAFYDRLTGLPNRALLSERLERSLEFSRRRPNYLFAVLFLDFDGFKNINDSLGHSVGDKVLVNVARRLEAMLRGNDTVARLGGDEYVLLLDDIEDLSAATHVAERIHRAMMVPFIVEGQEIFLTVSVGITLNSASYKTTEEVLRDADIAMYRAKAAGRNCYEVFDRGMHEAAMKRLEMEFDLHRSLENADFLLHFQPIVSFADGHVDSFEALVRWQRPRAGFTAPGEFIGLAEETGLIVQLDRWVLRQACQQMCRWLKTFGANACPGAISVNLSSRHFAQPDLVEFVAHTLRETGLPPHHLHLEITESAIMENVDGVVTLLRGLREVGVQVGLDDFGTGYSSLSYLHRLPLHTLKIDRSFVHTASQMTPQNGQSDPQQHDAQNWQIVRSIVMLAHGLGMKVVAEGIETSEQRDQLAAMNCDMGQGYLLSTPFDAGAASALIKAGLHRDFKNRIHAR